MCGIIGYVGKQNAHPILFNGLKRLEYRGYDSYGFALITENPGLVVETAIGQIGLATVDLKTNSTSGIAHTRWATHGSVTRENAHPQLSGDSKIAVVHNGILTNFIELRSKLKKLGHTFRSETDTEVIPRLIEEYIKAGTSFIEAVRLTVIEIGSEGSYAFACVHKDYPDVIAFAKNKSPLLVGLGDGENFVGSGEVAFLEYTHKFIPLDDMVVGLITPSSVALYDATSAELINFEGKITLSRWNIEEAQKGGFKHFMLKEIHDQPHAIKNTLLSMDQEVIANLSDLIIQHEHNSAPSTIFLVAAGTSYHSCMIGEFLFEKIAKIRTRAILPNVLESKELFPTDLVIAVSQSGETADTISALNHAKKSKVKIASIVNSVGTQIPRMSDACLYTFAGPEIGVAATKTFTTQVLSFIRLATETAWKKGTITEEKYNSLLEELNNLPDIISTTIKRTEYQTRKIAKEIRYSKSAYFLGTFSSHAVAMEGSLKLKEIAYVHAEGYNAAESKHGPIALIEKNFPVIFLAPNDSSLGHLLGNIQEMKARGAYSIVINEGNENIAQMADESIVIPKLKNSELFAIPASIVLQMISYYAASGKELNGEMINPDKPKNLAKSVTVS
jgi:glucosamine--fructose-6-phosphate aminotransferase (isomerizing)